MLAGTAVTLLIGLGCGDRAPKAPETPKEYPIKATVTAIDPDQKKVKLEHEEIPGLMSAMEIGVYRARSKVARGLQVGDKVEGTLEKAGPLTITKLNMQ